MSTDGCKRVEGAGRSKEASGLLVYLVEELGDARLRCAQLKKYVADATDMIEKSEHRDHFFEVAGNLIYGIPDVLMKLDKALDATALAAGRLDYEEIKNGLRPSKTDELESALQETRLRYLNRRSNEAPIAAGRTTHLPGKPGKTLCGEHAYPDTIVDSVKDSDCFYCVTAWEKANNAGTMYSRHLHASYGKESPMNAKTAHGYIAFYKGKQIEVEANTSLEAQRKAAEMFKAKKPHEVTVMLAEKDGHPVVHKPLFANKEPSMNAKSAAYFLNKIADLTDKQGRVPVAAVMTLVAKLEAGDRRAATLSGKASTAFRSLAASMGTQKNPSRVALAGVLRRIVGDTLSVGIQQPALAQQEGQQHGQQGQQQQALVQQQAGAGEDFQKANPKVTDEEAKVIDEMHDKNKDVVKDKAQQA